MLIILLFKFWYSTVRYGSVELRWNFIRVFILLANQIWTFDTIVPFRVPVEIGLKQLIEKLIHFACTICKSKFESLHLNALKSALFPHANTQSPDVAECIPIVMVVTWMFLWTSVTNPYAIYISPAGECATMLGQSKRTAAHCRGKKPH